MLRRLLFIFITLIATIATAIAQPYASRLGRFQVDQIKGCAPFSITLTNLLAGECTPGKPCIMNYEGTSQTNQFTYTYNTPGTYRLSVLYQSIGQDDITITVVPNTQPNFEIYSCGSRSARIRVTDNAYEQYVIDFDNNGTPEYTLPFSNNITTPTFTYPGPPPTSFTASVRGQNVNSAPNCTARTQSYTPIAVLPAPTMNTLTSVDANTIKLDFTTAVNIQYRLEIAVNNAASFSLVALLYGVNTYTVPNLRLDDNYYCFRIGAFDPCNNTTTYSGVVCSDRFTATAASDINNLVWATGATGTIINYTVTRNGSSTFTTTAQTFDDNAIVCKTNYCYRITTNYTGGAKSTSLEKCVTSFSRKVPTQINNASSVVSAGVEMTWVQDPAFVPVNYSVSRSSNGGTYSFLANAATNKYTDDVYTTNDRYCYKISYVDKCDNASPAGVPVCPIRLSGTLERTNAIQLNWSSYKGWRNGVRNYVIQQFNLAGAVIKTITTTDTTYLDNQADPNNQFVKYRITANANEPGITTSLSNEVEFIKNANIYYPTAFTPNGDNLNDKFFVSGQFIVKINLIIFDRWGAVVYASDKNDAWSGEKDGKMMPPSTYIWKVDITDLAGRTFSKEGTVVLMR